MRSAYTAQFFNGQDVGEVVAAGAFEFFGGVQAKHAEFSHLRNAFSGETMVLVDFGSDGLHFLFSELPYHILNHLLIFSKLEHRA